MEVRVKFTFLVALLGLSVGCTAEPVGLRHVSAIETRTRGVSFVDGGSTADAGMAGNTCRFDVGAGIIAWDTDVAQGEDDKITDSFNGDTVVVGRSGGFVVTGEARNPDLGTIFPGQNVVDARLTTEGAFGIVEEDGSCSVGWYLGSDEATQAPLGGCPSPSGVDVDRETGTAWIVKDGKVFTYDARGSDEFAPRADSVRWDGTTRALYTVTDGSHIAAYNEDGSFRWTAEVAGRITSFDDMGEGEGVVAMVEKSDGLGEIVFLESGTGTVRKSFETPSAGLEVVASPDGGTVAVVLENETHFFAVSLDR